MTLPRLTDLRERRNSTSATLPLWQPDPENEPQQLAWRSAARWIGYGGAAGGGKTDFALGKLLCQHRRSIIFRREYPQLGDIMDRATQIVGSDDNLNRSSKRFAYAPGRELEFGAMQREADRRKFRGRPHDGIAFDEVTEFTRSQVQYVTIWNRTTIPEQPCQIVMTFNPPEDASGEWVLDFFAPWLDPEFSGEGGPAKPGEIRWACTTEGPTGYRDVWVPAAGEYEIDGRTLTAESRTFVPARVEDNPHLMRTGYAQQLDALPPELRDAMRYGVMRRNIKDHPHQVIPRAWIEAAQARWEAFHEADDEIRVPLSQTGADVSRGGKDRTVIANRFGNYFALPVEHQGVDTDDGPKVAALVLRENDQEAPIAVDVIGIGSSVHDSLAAHHPDVHGINASARSEATDRSGKVRMRNLRAELHWRMREALDPEHGDDLMLPPGPTIRRQATAARYSLQVSGLTVEPKDRIKERMSGESPDHWEAILLAFAPLADPGYIDPDTTLELLRLGMRPAPQ